MTNKISKLRLTFTTWPLTRHAHMKRTLYLLLMILSVCTAEPFAAEPGTVGSPASPPFTPVRHYFTLEGQRYVTFIDEAAVVASPKWDMDQPPPISFKRVVEIARQGLRKLVTTEPGWKVRTITVHIANWPHEEKWYYDVLFNPPQGVVRGGNSVNMLVDFSGKPGKLMLARDDR
jgi:hypothetical protein